MKDFFWRTHFLTSEQLKKHMEGPTTVKKIRVIYTLTDWEMERYKTRSTVVFLSIQRVKRHSGSLSQTRVTCPYQWRMSSVHI